MDVIAGTVILGNVGVIEGDHGLIAEIFIQ